MNRATLANRHAIAGLMLGLIVEVAGSALLSEAWGQSELSQPLTIADLAAYRAALQPSIQPRVQPVPKVTFRDLWNQPRRFRGGFLEVEGRLARRFRQGKVGEFPPLVENWIFTPAGEPLCVVHPDLTAKGNALPNLGDTVRFEGTYLRTISYQGGDVARLAPLVVGPAPPLVVSAARGLNSSSFREWRIDWPVGLAVAAIVALVIGRQHLKGPVLSALERRRPEPPPEFVEGSSDLDGLARNRTEESDSSCESRDF